MVRKLILTLAITTAFGLATGAATSQVFRIPFSGCFVAEFPEVRGEPRLGEEFEVRAPGCRSATPFMLRGLVLQNPVPVPRPVACVDRCQINVWALVGHLESRFRTVIPNNPELVGACFGVQAGCLDFDAGCATLSGALGVCIQPPLD